MAYKIDSPKCAACHTCKSVCPMGAITTDKDGKCVIDTSKCISCGTCAAVCPVGAVATDI